ncbi:MAG: hypothetical protein IT383_21690 [Deltaproteobacteria bacterium]|nr:hypothetical protein [Deltaproteobacteria bacterium]
MTDPEILDAETAASAGTAPGGGLVELVAGALTKVLPGRLVKVDGGTIVVTGKVDGDVTVQVTPLFLIIGFRGARMAVSGKPPHELAAEAADKAARFATDALVVYEEHESAGLLRTVVIATDQGRFRGVVDEGQLPSAAPPPAARFYSCNGTVSRLPTREEQQWITRATGGFTGKLKRKLVAKVFKRVGATLEQAVAARSSAESPDEGRRSLGAPRD